MIYSLGQVPSLSSFKINQSISWTQQICRPFSCAHFSNWKVWTWSWGFWSSCFFRSIQGKHWQCCFCLEHNFFYVFPMQWGAAVPVIYSPGQVPSSGFAINQSTSRTLQAYQVTDQFSCVCVHIGRRCTAHELDLGDSAPAAFLRSKSRQTLPRWSRWKCVLARGTSWQQGERRHKRLLLWEFLCLKVVASIEGKMQTFDHACFQDYFFIRQIRITK